MNGIKFEIGKLIQEVTQVLIKPKQPSTRHLFDVNYYSFSHQVLHAAQMLLQCLEMDVIVRNQFKKLVSKMKQAAKCRPEEQSEEEQQLAGKDEISIFLNTRKPIEENKDRGELYKFLTIREQTQKDNQSFLHHMNKVKAMTVIKQKTHKVQTKTQEVQTQIAWISQFQYRSKQQANYYQTYLRSYLDKFLSQNTNIPPTIQKSEEIKQEDLEEKKKKVNKTNQKTNDLKKSGKNVKIQNPKKEELEMEENSLVDQFKKSSQSSKKNIGNIMMTKSKNKQKHKVKKINGKAANQQQPSKVEVFKTKKQKIAGNNGMIGTIGEQNLEFQQQHGEWSHGEDQLTGYHKIQAYQKENNQMDKQANNQKSKSSDHPQTLKQKEQNLKRQFKTTQNSYHKAAVLKSQSSQNLQQSQGQKQRRVIQNFKENKRKNYENLATVVSENEESRRLQKQQKSGSKFQSSGSEFKVKNSSINFENKIKTQIEEDETKNERNKQNLPAINVRIRQKTYLLQRGSDQKFNSSYYAGPKKFEKTPEINYSCHQSKNQAELDGLKQKVSKFLNKGTVEKNQMLENQKKIMQHLETVRKECLDSSTGMVVLNKREENQIKQCIRMMEAVHSKVCGKNCKHLDRFFSSLTIFKFSGRKQLKLSKYIIDSSNIL